MEYKRRNPEKVREYNRRYLYKGYTKEHEDVTNCQICKVDLTKFKRGDTVQCIDHDHKTGRIRGVLCGRCNKGLGHFKDSLEILREAIKYLEQ